MALDPRFILAYWASDYFVDKDTGIPLANGIVTFYKDNNRTELKNIFTLSGVPPYSTNSYVALPNPMTLSASGNPQDFDGNNVDIYFFPYEGNPSQEDGDVELYYITVTDQNGIPQFTRSAIPNIDNSLNPSNGDALINYVPNGQFLTHNAGKSNGSDADGKINQLITTIAPGGWTFERPTNSSNDKVTFYRFGIPLSGNPGGNPRYGVQMQCVSPSATDSFKHLRLKFDNVNRFASDTQQITFAFTGQSLGGNFDVSLYLIRNNGTGGSAAPPWQFIQSFTIGASFEIFQITFIPGLNTGATIGPDDDDYIQFAIAYPVDIPTNSIFTDFIITNGSVNITAYPEQTNAEYLSGTLSGYQVPDYDGYGIGLPVRETRNGYESDTSFVGKISPIGYDTSKLDWAEVLCDGTGYITQNYTTMGIPYARLQNKIFDATSNYPFFGTGPLFVTADIATGTAGRLVISTNQPGVQTDTADSGTGFTFVNMTAGSPTVNGWGVTAYHNWQNASNLVTVVGNTKGLVSNYAADFDTNIVIRQERNEANAYQVFTLDTATANLVTPSHYFTFETTPSNAFYLWNQVNGAGADPAPGGTGILINLTAGNSLNDIANYYSIALNGCKSTIITIGAAPAAGTYFSFYANLKQYVVYYKVNNVGAEPSVPGAIFIPVSIATGATAAQVTTATKLAINSYSFAVPDLRDMVIRGIGAGQWDVDYLIRMSRMPRGSNNLIGSIELDSILHHEHGTPVTAALAATGTDVPIPGPDSAASFYNTEYHMMTNTPPETILAADIGDYTIDQGETRGTNMAFHWTIHL